MRLLIYILTLLSIAVAEHYLNQMGYEPYKNDMVTVIALIMLCGYSVFLDVHDAIKK